MQAVYRTLAARGVVVLREGSGAFMAEQHQGQADATGLTPPCGAHGRHTRGRGRGGVCLF
ncbi:MAG: hypothetical protein VKS61_07555 [Candidatus Sericytochromatia bacterium]|nr:hypothetical protein [Candidatus Sericytochromatia bacterium]